MRKGGAALRGLILDLIPVLDTFDRALQAHEDPAYEEYRKGITLIRKTALGCDCPSWRAAHRGCREDIRSAPASGD